MPKILLTTAGPGRPKGIPNALTTSIKDAIQNAFTELGGTSYLVHVGRSDPRTFCALLGKLLPTKLSNADGSPLLADAQRAGLMSPPAAAIEVQGVVIAEPVQAGPEVQSVLGVTDPSHQRSQQGATEEDR